MCSTNFTGPLCAYGVSSYTPTNDASTQAVVCGNNYLPPRGVANTVGSLITINTTVLGFSETGCTCNPITFSDPTGTAGQVSGIFYKKVR